MILALTLLSLRPAILLTCTSFTKILVVLGLTRNALGLQQIPPNQVLAGLALFLSLFIMAPVLERDERRRACSPTSTVTRPPAAAFDDGVEPLRDFMLDNTGDDELELLTNVADRELPENRDDVALATLVPAFVLTELKQAFIIGFIIFIPFLVIDIVVSGALMALGMMMMPPVMVSLPFKLLLFVLVDGWALVITSLVSSYGSRGPPMTDTAVIDIALQTMLVALKLSAPILVTSLVDRLRDLAVPVDDPDPGVHARASCRSWSASGVALLLSRQLDAAHPDRLHPGPLRAASRPCWPERRPPMTLSVAGEPLLAYLLASVRIVAWLALVPPFSGRAVPDQAKVVLSLGLALAVAPSVADSGRAGRHRRSCSSARSPRSLIGAAHGLRDLPALRRDRGRRQPHRHLRRLLARRRASTRSSMNMNTVFGKFHQMLATVLLFASGGHLLVIGGLLQDLRGAAARRDARTFGGAADVLITAFAMFFMTAVQIALPLIAVLFVADLGLALLTKVAPQLNAINVMFPAKIGLTLLLLGLSFPVLPEAIDAPRRPRQPRRARRSRAGGETGVARRRPRSRPPRSARSRARRARSRGPRSSAAGRRCSLVGMVLPTRCSAASSPR